MPSVATSKAPPALAAKQQATAGVVRKARVPQRLPSNQSLLRLQRKCSCGGSGGCDECLKREGLAIQAKVAVGPSDDPSEREADRVADLVMASPSPVAVGPVAPAGATLSRQCAACEDEEGLIQPERGPSATSTGAIDVGSALRAAGRPGVPLSGATRDFFEPRLSHDFGRVRVHTDGPSADAARGIQARAYTLGTDIVFAAGEYRPASAEGRRLIAHELVHVIQQGQSPPTATNRTIRRQPEDAVADEPEEPQLTRPQEIALSRTSPGEYTGSADPVTLSLYNFGIDVAQPKTEHRAVLNELGRLLKEHVSVTTTVRVIGFADSTGDERYNLRLSKRRADAVQAVLKPMIPQKVALSAYGETNPAASNESVSGRSRNRRVDIRFATNLPPPTIPPPRRRPDPPGKDTPEPEPPGPQPPGGGGGETDDDTSFCEDYPLLCGLGVIPFFLPLICVIAPELCLVAVCALAPPLCTLPPIIPDPPEVPPEEPTEPEEDPGRPSVRFTPDVRAPNTPIGMNDRIGLRDPVTVNAVVTNPPPATSPITIEVDGTGPRAGVATVNGQAQIEITGTTALEIKGTRMSADGYPFSPFLQLAAWWSNDLAGAGNRFAVSTISEDWTAAFDAALRRSIGTESWARMDWASDSGAHSDMDALPYVEFVEVDSETGGMVGLGPGGVNEVNENNTCDFHPTFDEHGTPYAHCRSPGTSRIKQLFRIRDRRSNSNWAPAPNSGFEIIRVVDSDPAHPGCWRLSLSKRGATVTIGGMTSAAGGGEALFVYDRLNCPTPPPKQEDPPPVEEPPVEEDEPPVEPSGPPPCDKVELSRRVDQCIGEARQAAIDCGMGLIPFGGGWGGIGQGIEIYFCLDQMKEDLLECDRKAKRDTNCPDDA